MRDPDGLIDIVDEPARRGAGGKEPTERGLTGTVISEPMERDGEIPVVERPARLGEDRALERRDGSDVLAEREQARAVATCVLRAFGDLGRAALEQRAGRRRIPAGKEVDRLRERRCLGEIGNDVGVVKI